MTTKPTESMETMIKFVTNMKAIEGAMDFISDPVAVEYLDDFSEGLDGILTDEDLRFMEYSKRYGPVESAH